MNCDVLRLPVLFDLHLSTAEKKFWSTLRSYDNESTAIGCTGTQIGVIVPGAVR